MIVFININSIVVHLLKVSYQLHSYMHVIIAIDVLFPVV